MFNVSGVELMIILTLGLMVLGPTRLPQVARQIGKVMTELRQMADGFKAEMNQAFEDTTPTSPQAPAPLAPPAPPAPAPTEPGVSSAADGPPDAGSSTAPEAGSSPNDPGDTPDGSAVDDD